MIKYILLFNILISTAANAQEFLTARHLAAGLDLRDKAVVMNSPAAAVTGSFAMRYVRDVFDSVTAQPFCYRKISDDQLSNVVRRYIKNNRLMQNESSYLILLEVFSTEYPCN